MFDAHLCILASAFSPCKVTMGVDSTSKCTTESALDDLSWRSVAEAFARSIIQVIYDHGKMFVTDL